MGFEQDCCLLCHLFADQTGLAKIRKILLLAFKEVTRMHDDHQLFFGGIHWDSIVATKSLDQVYFLNWSSTT